MKIKKDRDNKDNTNTYYLLPITYYFPHGGVAQLGEHLPCKQGVMGSIPIISTSGKLPRPGTIEDRLKSNLQRSLVEPDESRA